MKISALIKLFKTDFGGSSDKNVSVASNRPFQSPNSPAQTDVAMSFLISRAADMKGGSNGIDKKDDKNSDPVVYKILISFPKAKLN